MGLGVDQNKLQHMNKDHFACIFLICQAGKKKSGDSVKRSGGKP